MNSFHCFQPVKSSGELKSRGVKVLPGKDNTNKLSLSKSFICLMQQFSFFSFYFYVALSFLGLCFFLSLSLLHCLVKELSYSTRFCRSAVSLSFLWPLVSCCPGLIILTKRISTKSVPIIYIASGG